MDHGHYLTRRSDDEKLGPMYDVTRKMLEDFYRPYNSKLAELLKDDIFLWE